MAASAYAALVSLSRILKQILHPSKQHWIRLDMDRIMSLDNKVGSLVNLLEDLSNRRNSSKFITDELMNQMANAGHEAEDIIDSYVAKIFSDDPAILFADCIRSLMNQIGNADQKTKDHIVDYVANTFSSIRRTEPDADHIRELLNLLGERFGQEAEDILHTYVAETAINRIESDAEPAVDAEKRKRELVNLLGQQFSEDSEVVENRIRELSTHFCEDIKRVAQTMDLMNQNLIQIQTKMDDADDDTLSRSGTAPNQSSSSNNVKNVVMVGFEDQLLQIIDKLTNTAKPKLQIISIVGMGGLGKTTLAKSIYDKSIIVDYFRTRAWVTLSQTYNVRQVILALLYDALNVEEKKQREKFTKEMSGKNDEELGLKLHKCLFGRKYLIVIDDIWSTADWHRLKRFFPDNKNGSKIMMTTRLSYVANSLGSKHNSHALKFLDEDKSWNLFCNKVFPGQGCCPLLELEEIGRKIAKSCRGLPLAIVAIGGLLANSNKTPEYWEYVAENLNLIINSGDDDCLKILSLSYNDLPIHLKPCFLYMAMFPEDCDINVNRLVRLWVAEGFLKPIKDQSLEDVAKVYLNDLIDRNLILVGERGRTGRMKSCKIHDVLRDLCTREAHKESFICVIRVGSSIVNNILEGIKSKRRIAIHQNNKSEPRYCPEEELINALKSATNARSLVCELEGISSSVVPCLNLVRVLDVVHDKYSAEEITKLRSLRYGSFHCNFESNYIPWKFPQWNLQTSVCSGYLTLPYKIWEMTEVRHIKFDVLVDLARPQNESYTLENLQTLDLVVNFRWREEVIKRVLNLRKLKMLYYEEDGSIVPSGDEWGTYYGINNLVHFHKLESLDLRTSKTILLANISFPRSLRKLVLNGCDLPWSDIKVMGSLPLLESLVLLFNAFEGTRWDAATTDDQGGGELFVRLKYLQIQSLELKYWTAEATHFPMLEKLFLYCEELEGIPLGFAQIPTLQLITLATWKPCVMNSARKILEEREYLGYEGFRVDYYNDEEGCWASVEIDG